MYFCLEPLDHPHTHTHKGQRGGLTWSTFPGRSPNWGGGFCCDRAVQPARGRCPCSLEQPQCPVTGWTANQEQRLDVNHRDHKWSISGSVSPATWASTPLPAAVPALLSISHLLAACRGRGKEWLPCPALSEATACTLTSEFQLCWFSASGHFHLSLRWTVRVFQDGESIWGSLAAEDRALHPSVLPPEDIFQSPLYQAPGRAKVRTARPWLWGVRPGQFSLGLGSPELAPWWVVLATEGWEKPQGGGCT